MWNMLGSAMIVPSLKIRAGACSKLRRYPKDEVIVSGLKEQQTFRPRRYPHLAERERDCSTIGRPEDKLICPTVIWQLSTKTAQRLVLQASSKPLINGGVLALLPWRAEKLYRSGYHIFGVGSLWIERG
jgi:hypothetical protein